MFVCAITGKQSRPVQHDADDAKKDIPAEKPTKVVADTRERIYTKRFFNEETREVETHEVGRGWEIVKEINVSEEGLRLWNSWSDAERRLWLDS